MDFLRSLLPHVEPALIVLARLTGLFLYAPVLSSPAIPARHKAFLAVALAGAAYLVLAPTLASASATASHIPINLISVAPVIASEILIGLVIGFLAGLPLMAAQVGGLTIGQQLGLGLAQTYNPTIDDEAEVIGQGLFFLALAGFISLGGLEAMLSTVLHSFSNVPPGAFRADENLLVITIGLIQSAFELSLRIAAPVLCLIFLETIALGFINRTAPAFNILSLGFPIRVLLGFALLICAIAAIDSIITDELVDAWQSIAAYFHSL